MSNFPGNPYALPDGAQTSPEQGIYQAVMTLAFEVRTATMLEASKPNRMDPQAPASVIESVLASRKEVAERLGRENL